MSVYAWPADYRKTDRGIVLVFPEWPDLAPVGDTVQDAMVGAAAALSGAVALRIENNETIPAPGDLGPHQVPIGISDATSARLDRYLEERKIDSFRQQVEIEHINRERRAAFLTEYKTSIEPVERIADRSDAAAIEFAVTGVKFCYILNAGGLVAIPAIMGVISKTAPAGSLLFWPSIVFVFGVLLSALTNYLAYQSLVDAAEGSSCEITARALVVNGIFYPPDDDGAHKGEIAQKRIEHDQKLGKARRFANVGIFTFAGAVVSFLLGVGLVIQTLA